MRWIVVAIVSFIIVYTGIMIGFRKEEAPHNPYEQAHFRSGYDLMEAGWEPFPNAFAVDMDSPVLERAPYLLEPIPLGKAEPDAPGAADWSHLVPDVQQGEEVEAVEGARRIGNADPYIGRIHWVPPEDFHAPQLVFFRRNNEILAFSRVPPNEAPSVNETAFLIPPEVLSPGEYRFWLASGSELSVWTFEVTP